jgi:hypothetical protein
MSILVGVLAVLWAIVRNVAMLVGGVVLVVYAVKLARWLRARPGNDMPMSNPEHERPNTPCTWCVRQVERERGALTAHDATTAEEHATLVCQSVHPDRWDPK